MQAGKPSSETIERVGYDAATPIMRALTHAGTTAWPHDAEDAKATGSIYTKLLAIGVPTIILVNIVVCGVLAVLQYRAELMELKDKRTILMSTEARVLEPDLSHFRAESIAIHLAQLVTEPDIVEAIVYDPLGFEVARAAGHDASTDLETRVWPIDYANPANVGDVSDISTLKIAHESGSLSVTFTSQYVKERFWRHTLAGFAGAALSSAALILFIGWMTRRMIGAPLKRLMAAFEASQRDGRRHRVDWSSDDEFGRVANAFNRMQGWLDIVDSDRQAFQDRLERFYHGTPVMLHSVDEAGVLQQVSTHWCNETGYWRGEVIGQPLTRFLTPESTKLYSSRILPDYLISGFTDETPLQFVCADGRVMDVLLAETRESHTNEAGSPSLSVMTDISKIKLAERELERLVATDSITGLFNRRGFLIEVEKAIATGRGATIAFVDLDRFKRINDTYGHPAGDQLLMTISARLKEIVAWEALPVASAVTNLRSMCRIPATTTNRKHLRRPRSGRCGGRLPWRAPSSNPRAASASRVSRRTARPRPRSSSPLTSRSIAPSTAAATGSSASTSGCGLNWPNDANRKTTSAMVWPTTGS